MGAMKTKSRLFAGYLLLTVCLSGGFGMTSAWAGTEIFLYPVARAFGSPSESELARCRVAFKQLQTGFEKSRVVVMPVLFADAGRCQWRSDLAAAEMRELATRTSAKIEVSLVEPKVAALPRFHNQLRYFGNAPPCIETGSKPRIRQVIMFSSRKFSVAGEKLAQFRFTCSIRRGRSPIAGCSIRTSSDRIFPWRVRAR